MVTSMEEGLQSTKTNTETYLVGLQSGPNYFYALFLGFVFPIVFVVWLCLFQCYFISQFTVCALCFRKTRKP